MYYTDNPVADEINRTEAFEAWLATCPICECCGEPIQDEDAYKIEGVLIHEDCVLDYLHEHCRVTVSEVFGW